MTEFNPIGKTLKEINNYCKNAGIDSEISDIVIETPFPQADSNGNKDPINVTLKESKFNSSKIKEYNGEDFKKFEFRPTTWEQFIGQKEAKIKAQTILKKAYKGIRCHFLVDGIKGHGKTTFVELIGKSLNAKIIERIGKQVDEDSLIDIINEINTSKDKFVIFFVDEIDTMDWKVLKVLNPVIEQFKIENKKIKPFIFAGATINKHSLVKNNPDTLDRIPTHIKFTRYNSEEIKEILTQYWKQLYPNEKFTNIELEQISENCKFNPRTAIAFLEELIVEDNIEKILKSSNIIVKGLTKIDIKILNILSKQKRPMGANALAQKCGLSQNEYMKEYEPFLCEYEYINRIPSRIIADKGIKILEKIK